MQAETDAFFKRFPDLERTELTAAFIGALVIEKISAGADSQFVPSTETQNKKVA